MIGSPLPTETSLRRDEYAKHAAGALGRGLHDQGRRGGQVVRGNARNLFAPDPGVPSSEGSSHPRRQSSGLPSAKCSARRGPFQHLGAGRLAAALERTRARLDDKWHSVRFIITDIAAWRPVHVEVGDDHKHRISDYRAGDHTVRHGRQDMRPLRVGDVHCMVDHRLHTPTLLGEFANKSTACTAGRAKDNLITACLHHGLNLPKCCEPPEATACLSLGLYLPCALPLQAGILRQPGHPRGTRT